MKRAECRVVSCQRLSAEKPHQRGMMENGIDITHIQTGVSRHFRSLKDEVLKIELGVTH